MQEMNRRTLLTSAATFATIAAMDSVSARAADGAASTETWLSPVPLRDKAGITDGVVWHDVREWGVEGKGFADTERYFDRLPAR